MLSGLSLLAAGWMAERFGLNTMVFTHLPPNLLLILVPLAPAAWLAILFFPARMTASQMDLPTRKSYTMADPDERTAAAGLTNVARTVAGAVAPVFSSAAVRLGALGLPFSAAGALKIAYDGLIYWAFRNVRPPEERRPLTSTERSERPRVRWRPAGVEPVTQPAGGRCGAPGSGRCGRRIPCASSATAAAVQGSVGSRPIQRKAIGQASANPAVPSATKPNRGHGPGATGRDAPRAMNRTPSRAKLPGWSAYPTLIQPDASA